MQFLTCPDEGVLAILESSVDGSFQLGRWEADCFVAVATPPPCWEEKMSIKTSGRWNFLHLSFICWIHLGKVSPTSASSCPVWFPWSSWTAGPAGHCSQGNSSSSWAQSRHSPSSSPGHLFGGVWRWAPVWASSFLDGATGWPASSARARLCAGKGSISFKRNNNNPPVWLLLN